MQVRSTLTATMTMHYIMHTCKCIVPVVTDTIVISEMPEMEFLISSAKLLIECAATEAVFAEVGVLT